MKYLPVWFREAQSEHFGKRGYACLEFKHAEDSLLRACVVVLLGVVG